MRAKSANCACKWCSYMDKHGETAWPWLAYQSGIKSGDVTGCVNTKNFHYKMSIWNIAPYSP